MVCKRTQIRKIIEEFAAKLEDDADIPVQEIILFGSYAWGKPRASSDIDLAVISKKFKNMEQIRRIEVLSNIARHLAPQLPIDIDVVGFTYDEITNAGYFDLASKINSDGKRFLKKAA